MDGSMRYHAGLSAEDQVARRYAADGRKVVARRWRGTGGEIDVVATDGEETVFVEVKKARSHAAAAERLGSRQIARILACASEYMAGLATGSLTPVRFDVALVDEQGRIEIRENALWA
jgi:putative endonuclease